MSVQHSLYILVKNNSQKSTQKSTNINEKADTATIRKVIDEFTKDIEQVNKS